MTSTSLSLPRVISEWSDQDAAELLESFLGEKVIALDVEGCYLSRLGNISIVQVATNARCYIFDVFSKNGDHPLVMWLRDLLENEAVVKVVHDCRWDSDALFHHLGIRLSNVHDTSCWHRFISQVPDVSLNDVLSFYGLPGNIGRDKTVYERYEDFWAERPLTEQMIAWASGDTRELINVHSQQIDRASESDAERAKQASNGYLEDARSAQVITMRVSNPGKFIGRRGANVRELQRRTNTLISTIGQKSSKMFMVFYHSERELSTVQRAAKRC